MGSGIGVQHLTTRRKKNGAFCLSPDGRGWWKNWASDSEVNSWKDDSATVARPLDMARIEAQRQRDRAYRIEAMKNARALWQRSPRLLGGHPYLTRKGLTMMGCTGLKVSREGDLLVPVIHGEWVISIQSITKEGDKKFFAGCSVKGGAYAITRQRAAVTCIVEGVATGLAVFQAIPQAQVIVAFDAGNLLPVVQRLRPYGSVVICADNDHGTMARRGFNPGLEKARNAAEFLGCGVAYPEDVFGSATDWCDVLQSYGAGGHKFVAREILKQAKYIAPA